MVYLENAVGGKEMIPVYLDITILDLKCEHVTLDIQDGHGRYWNIREYLNFVLSSKMQLTI